MSETLPPARAEIGVAAVASAAVGALWSLLTVAVSFTVFAIKSVIALAGPGLLTFAAIAAGVRIYGEGPGLADAFIAIAVALYTGIVLLRDRMERPARIRNACGMKIGPMWKRQIYFPLGVLVTAIIAYEAAVGILPRVEAAAVVGAFGVLWAIQISRTVHTEAKLKEAAARS